MSFPPNLTPAAVQDTTSTSGASSLALDDNPGTGYRSFKDAFNAGDLASGNTVTFSTWDSTVDAPGKVIELATGVWTNTGGGGTLTRATIHQPNGTPVSWPASGTRTVMMVPDSLQRLQNGADVPDGDAFCDAVGAARINFPNIFDAQIQRFQEQVQVFGTVAAGIFLALRTDNQATASTSNKVQWRKVLKNDAGNARIGFEVLTSLSNIGLGTEESLVEFKTMEGGAQGNALRLVGRELQDRDGGRVLSEGQFIDIGDELIWATAPPVAWTRQNETIKRVIQLAVSGDTIGGTASGTDIFTGGSYSSQDHVLSVAELAAHTHTVFHGIGIPDANNDGATLVTGRVLAQSGGDDKSTTSAGSDTGHSHDILSPHSRIMARYSYTG